MRGRKVRPEGSATPTLLLPSSSSVDAEKSSWFRNPPPAPPDSSGPRTSNPLSPSHATPLPAPPPPGPRHSDSSDPSSSPRTDQPKLRQQQPPHTCLPALVSCLPRHAQSPSTLCALVVVRHKTFPTQQNGMQKNVDDVVWVRDPCEDRLCGCPAKSRRASAAILAAVETSEKREKQQAAGCDEPATG